MKSIFSHGDKAAALAAGQVQDHSIAGKRKAAGDWTFAGQPAANDTITVNGTVFTFVAAGATGNQILIGASLTATIDNAVTLLQASGVAGVALATYSNVGGTKLRAVYDTYGSAGNAFTVAEAGANITVAAATLLGGFDGDAIKLDAETYALVTAAATASTTDVEFDLPGGSEGQEVTLYLKTKGAGANAKVNGTFSGGTVLTLDTVGDFAKLKCLNGTWYTLVNSGGAIA